MPRTVPERCFFKRFFFNGLFFNELRSRRLHRDDFRRDPSDKSAIVFHEQQRGLERQQKFFNLDTVMIKTKLIRYRGFAVGLTMLMILSVWLLIGEGAEAYG